MSMAHNSIQVKCSMQEPMQLLMDKLSSSSSDLYIFWQNYNQMYLQYNERLIEITRLKQEIDVLRREKSRNFATEEQVHRQKVRAMEHHSQDLKTELERLRSDSKELKKHNVLIITESDELRSLITQLREENNLQRVSIEQILVQLRQAQTEISSYSKVYEDAVYKESVINKFIDRENQLQECLAERDDQIEELLKETREAKHRYQQLLQEGMQNAKNRVIQSLPGLLKNSKRSVQLVTESIG